ncbi:ATPase [Sulfolobus sp. E5-1-F]|uniref:N-acetylglucosamine kinase n=1 Tax=Sulfolobaceae TaxID=118883 RepID=UPI00129653B0|nr:MULTISPECIES: N-acetylglucosamine kinase [unclassified Sulfolobus]QGA54365.1 ATPase [Sulfolobus sp. E5-1-F]QGA69414.1 ATPase [Sulfolobus sp. E11-6]
MEYLLIDAGGTSTKVFVYDGEKVVRQYKYEPASVDKVGPYKSVLRLNSIISSFNKKFNGIAISLAGIDSEGIAKEVKSKLYPLLSKYADKVIIEHDAHVVLMSNADKGCITIAGTGSIVYGFDGSKRIIKGDRGWLVGDICSGFWLGREFLHELLREFQGLSNDRSLIRFSNFNSEEDLVRFLYKNSCNPAKIAQYSVNLLNAVKQNSTKAIRILNTCISEFSTLVQIVCKAVNSNVVYYFGGMYESPVYLSFFSRELEKKGIKSVKSKSVINGLLKLLEL